MKLKPRVGRQRPLLAADSPGFRPCSMLLFPAPSRPSTRTWRLPRSSSSCRGRARETVTKCRGDARKEIKHMFIQHCVGVIRSVKRRRGYGRMAGSPKGESAAITKAAPGNPNWDPEGSVLTSGPAAHGQKKKKKKKERINGGVIQLPCSLSLSEAMERDYKASWYNGAAGRHRLHHPLNTDRDEAVAVAAAAAAAPPGPQPVERETR
ncbi:hypothetical protein EYF80_025158 [Liparis tanakae]|uniref:Uncharacterized protein n=1 Tax=Liparis tanakae TaxID=230148 RepID=A0A4Z2HFM5_9TELE|nr:hypothetical protein EYF80_025158 [Liparis tanakae]